ncbi:hypothetical protein POTOM_053086 [Populus tomentosa]|uniref:Uncharacterized protein n=1 Tax=Populus tomentosa TaxID=118781 RepID=A0A8X8C0U9_POPTO|nr:hypothetical protein POTOM_053086 [Populus tomentosa]
METKRKSRIASVLFFLISLPSVSFAYRPGDIVPMSKMGQYHSSRTVWHDMIGKHCPIFAVNREVLIPIAKPTGYTGSDPYKLSFQVGKEKFLIPWLFVIHRKSSEVPMIDVHLRYSGSDLHGVTAKVIDMPHHLYDMAMYPVSGLHPHSVCIFRYNLGHLACLFPQKSAYEALDVEIHPDIRQQFWDAQRWPKHILIRYTWKEQSEIDVSSGFYVLFGSGLMLSFILSIYILQSSRDKLARFVRETVAESSIPEGGVAKVE